MPMRRYPCGTAALGGVPLLEFRLRSRAGGAMATSPRAFQRQGVRHPLNRSSIAMVSIAVPFMLLLIGFSKPLVRILFQRGAFSSADAESVRLDTDLLRNSDSVLSVKYASSAFSVLHPQE